MAKDFPDGFVIDSMNPVRHATPMSVAAHSLYEQGDPYRVIEPEGVLDTTRARYDALDEHRCRVSGAQWTVGASIPTELKAQLGPYVNISLDTDRPYDHFDEHRQDYPAEAYKKKKK